MTACGGDITGKRGTLTIRDRNEWVDVGNDGNGDGQEDAIAFSTGRSCAGPASTPGSSARGVVPCRPGCPWYARYEGILTLPKCAEPHGAVREGSPLRPTSSPPFLSAAPLTPAHGTRTIALRRRTDV